MAVPYYVHARAAVEASLHVQIEIDSVEPPVEWPGPARVSGRIARVFRGDPALVGSRAVTTVDCSREDDSIPESAAIWKRWESLKDAHVLEAYLNREGEDFAIASWQSTVLPALTHVPQLVITEEDAREPPSSPVGRFADLALFVWLVLFVGAGLAGLCYALWAAFR